MKKTKVYMDVNGFDCDSEPNVCVGYHLYNEETGINVFAVKTLDARLFHPNTSDFDIKRSTIRFEPVTEEQYMRYKKYLNKRNEVNFNKLAREI